MPFRKISRGLKLAAIRLYEREILPLWDVLAIMDLSRRTFFRILKLWHETGDVVTHKHGNLAGRPRILDFDDIHYVLQLVRLRPDWFLDELLELLETNRFISTHYVTIHRELQRAGVSYKKLKRIALERNEEARNAYIARISQYEPEEIGFLDETSKNDKTAARGYGRAKKGRRATMNQRFVRGTRLSATALLTVDGIMASTVVEGSMNREMYLEFLEHRVVSVKHVQFTT
jgi:transposase